MGCPLRLVEVGKERGFEFREFSVPSAPIVAALENVELVREVMSCDSGGETLVGVKQGVPITAGNKEVRHWLGRGLCQEEEWIVCLPGGPIGWPEDLTDSEGINWCPEPKGAFGEVDRPAKVSNKAKELRMLETEDGSAETSARDADDGGLAARGGGIGDGPVEGGDDFVDEVVLVTTVVAGGFVDIVGAGFVWHDEDDVFSGEGGYVAVVGPVAVVDAGAVEEIDDGQRLG